MIKQHIGGYRFGRGQLTGKFLTGPLAGRGVYFGDVEANRTFTAGDEFKRQTPESAEKLTTFIDVDGSEIGGSLTFYQWNEMSRRIAAMANETPKDQVSPDDLTVSAPAIAGDVIMLGKFAVTDLVVSDGAAVDPVIYDEGVHYQVHNDGNSPAVVSLIAIPEGADEVAVATFDAPLKKLNALYLLSVSQFEMQLMFQERVKPGNPTKPATTVLERVSVVLDGDITLANTSAELATVTAKFTCLANTNLPEGEQIGYMVYPD